MSFVDIMHYNYGKRDAGYRRSERRFRARNLRVKGIEVDQTYPTDQRFLADSAMNSAYYAYCPDESSMGRRMDALCRHQILVVLSGLHVESSTAMLWKRLLQLGNIRNLVSAILVCHLKSAQLIGGRSWLRDNEEYARSHREELKTSITSQSTSGPSRLLPSGKIISWTRDGCARQIQISVLIQADYILSQTSNDQHFGHVLATIA
ncbi:hypothetical protein GLOTRDRAFT_92727 [Gloeophyllum trabeum ATCC 11539]|uniref:Uncharacterized protein n=1 Tax=Gloeophyllum trabeum (strain ATCC 11539 / FP-39264 / Madison 617) TaxID=670483 RepID=S7RSY1_GLOTA|nr:uncharacterized protein GLOTRDRAFT_92727 [Gloeophyllum trabeum ATCC 11539]EPQ56199.1 hypothetical protein GLOTRDRAFT_92727 [Gloeophyllum trabeum ATCC 11539]